MRVLITGATGFVGPYLIEHCTEHGDEVVDAGDATTGFDIADRDSCFATFERLRPDVVYHLAALSHVGDSWADPTPCLRINIEGTANVLDASAKVGAQRVLLIGSSEEYGKVSDPTTPVKEDEPLRPLSPYGASKVAASYLGVQAFYARDLPVVRVRAFGHTGPGQSPKFVVPALAHRIAAAEKSGANEIVMGSLTPVRDLSDVRDIVRAYRLLLTTGEPGEVYNVGRGVGSTIGDIAKSLIAQSTATLEIVTDPALVRPVEMPGLIADTSKIRAATGWEPEHSLDDTLAAMLEAARNE